MSNSRTRSVRRAAVAAGISLIGLTSGWAVQTSEASAQNTAGAADSDEVVVTARRREELLQETPVAVTAFSQEDLRENSIRQPIDLQYATPSLTVSSATANTSIFAIRGQGQVFGAPPGVLTYFAGAPIETAGYGRNSVGSAQFGMFDLQSVQVLKGPQGTLFGRTSTGGAVLFEPHHPTEEFGGYVDFQAGSYNLNYFEGAVNVPLIPDVLSMRVSGLMNTRDGYTTSYTTGQDLDNVDVNGWRVGVNFRPTDWFENYTLLQYNSVNNNIGTVLSAATPALYTPALYTGNLTALCGGLALGFGAADVPTFTANCVAQRQGILAQIQADFATALAASSSGDIRHTFSGLIADNPAETLGLINQTTIDLPDLGPFSDLRIRNVLALPSLDSTSTAVYDITGIASPVGYLRGPTLAIPGSCATTGPTQGVCTPGSNRALSYPSPDTNYTEEVNFSGNIGILEFIAGYFYYRRETEGLQPASAFAAFGNIFSPTLTAAPPNPATNAQIHSLAWERGTYINGILDLSQWVEGLHLSGGYRWNENYSSVTTGTVSRSVATFEESSNNYTLGVDWQVTPDLLLFVRRASGLKPGGLNPPQCPIATPVCSASYGQEEVISTEVGAKWDWSIGNLQGRTNIGYFNAESTGRQGRGTAAFGVPATLLSYTTANGEATQQGVELEQTLIWGENLRILFNYSQLETDVEKAFSSQPAYPFINPVVYVARACTDPVNNSNNDCADYAGIDVGGPEYQVNLSVSYDFHLGDNAGVLTPTINYYTQGDVRGAPIFPALPAAFSTDIPSYDLVNVRLDWRDVMGNPGVDLAIFGRNVGDTVYRIGANGVLDSLGNQTWTYGAPEMWGASLRYSF